MQKQEIQKDIKEPEDKLFVAKLLDKITERDTRNKIAVTDFLNLHERMLSEEILKRQKTGNYMIFGGYEEAERTLLILYPDKLEETYIPLEQWLCVIRITLPKHQESYSHREYLGGIMKLGVKREKIGDIVVLEDGADIIVKADIADFLIDELGKLTRFRKAEIERKSIRELRRAVCNKEELQLIVSSYRIDAVVAELLHISRARASDIIKEERVFVNAVVCENGAKPLRIGDKITVRGKGRFEIVEELGCTKKENIRIKVLRYS